MDATKKILIIQQNKRDITFNDSQLFSGENSSMRNINGNNLRFILLKTGIVYRIY